MIIAACLMLIISYGIVTSYAIYDYALLREGEVQDTISTDAYASEDMSITLTTMGTAVSIALTVERAGILVVYETGSMRSYLSYGDGTMSDEVSSCALEDIRIRVYGSTGIWRTPLAVYDVHVPSDV